MTMWRCSSQDYRGWRTADLKQPHPPVSATDFATIEEARAEAALRRAQGLTVCVSPTPDPRRGTPRIRFPEPDLPPVPRDARRLTP